ncbi:MAG: c-type cytochrome [Rhodospirillales bacterium]
MRAAVLAALVLIGAMSPTAADDALSVNECLGCHGLPGLHRSSALPTLFGQDRKYLMHQMRAFQRDFVGVQGGFLRLDRKHPVMSTEAPRMVEKEISVIAAWLTRQPCLNASDVGDGGADVPLPEHGTVCLTCHGQGGRSVTAFVPNLAGQRRGYLRAQLIAFRDSGRPEKADPGRSRTHNMMTRQGGYLDDVQINDLAAYFAGQSCR